MSSASGTSPGRLPDFIIIGAMKCATSTLHEQLASQQGVFMSTPKEPCFFSDDAQWNRGERWYRGLFEPASPGALCGESSTHYTKLPTHPQTVERMRQMLPGHCRFIYVMRHPIDRLVSQYIHEWTQREIDEPIDAAIECRPQLIAYSRYSMQLQPYIEMWGRGRILPLFFERVAEHQQESLERVCSFIGYAGHPQWNSSVAEQNVSSQRLRRSVWRDAVTKFPGMTTLRRALVPQGVRDRIKRRWMMTERPQLSDANRARLESIFDEDLARLSSWFGLHGLSCPTFKTMALQGHPSWKTECAAT